MMIDFLMKKIFKIKYSIINYYYELPPHKSQNPALWNKELLYDTFQKFNQMILLSTKGFITLDELKVKERIIYSMIEHEVVHYRKVKPTIVTTTTESEAIEVVLLNYIFKKVNHKQKFELDKKF